MASIAELFVRVRGDTTDFTRKMGGVKTSMSTLETSVKRLALSMGGGLLGAAFLKNTIEAQNAIAQLNAVVKSTGGAAGFTAPQLSTLAGELQKVSTFSDEAIMGAQGLLLTFTNIRGEALTGATKAVLDLAQAMGGDLRGAAIQLGKALQDPNTGMTALRRSGVSFSEAQQKVIKDLFNTGRAAEAQKMILKELEVQFGGSAAAARNTLGGALTALKNAFGDALEASQESSSGIIDALNSISAAMPAIRQGFNWFFTQMNLGFIEMGIGAEKANISLAKFQLRAAAFLSHVPGLQGFAWKEANIATAILGKDGGASTLEALEKLREKWVAAAMGIGNAAPSKGGGGTVSPVDTSAPVKALASSYNQLRDAIESARKEAEEFGKEFWRSLINARGEADELTRSMSDLFLKSTLDIPQSVGDVDISPSVKQAGKDGQKITDNASKNTKDLQAAIWGAASQSASIIVSALNIGGGGRGSGLGGAIGSTAGFALGFAFGGGPIGGAIGATIGNIAGSLLGGLFDKKDKATNRNTDAVRALTQAMLLNAPSGFKVEPYRYGASVAASRGGETTVNIYGVTDAKEVARVVSKYATRGGAPLLGMT